MVALLAVLLSLPMSLLAAVDGNIVTQPQLGKQVVTVPTTGELVFYDPKGTGSMASTSTNNTLSMTVFKPAEQGMAVQVTFETCDVTNDGDNWPGKVVVYNGDPDAAGTFAWPDDRSDIGEGSALPDGDVQASMDAVNGAYRDVTYYSMSGDGVLSVGMLWRYAASCDGWVAKVKCVKLENMTVTGATTLYDNVMATPAVKKGVAFASFNVATTGVMNADVMTKVKFRVLKNEDMLDPLRLQLYAGKKSSYGDEVLPLFATVQQDGGSYVFTTEQTLSAGDNYYTIVGDILDDAAVGAKAQVEIEDICTGSFPNGVTPISKAQSVEVCNPAIAIMQPGSQTITVGDTPLAFYDDGGLDGQVTASFSGTTTFVPSVEGQKVQADFSKVALANGSIYYQYINVYNGKEATEASLIRTLRHGDTALIHSTSADGALTVQLADNGTAQTADGFEATVSLFVPQAMTLRQVDVTAASTATVGGGDTAQPMLGINIQTVNTEPAMTLEKVEVSANGTNAIIGKAALYYTKAGNEVEVSDIYKVGEAEVTTDRFTITLTQPVSLLEGDNRLWLAYDIKDEAVNGQAVDAALLSVQLNGSTVAVDNGNPEGDRKVENVVISHADQGTVTKTVNGEVMFKTKNKNEYSSYYESGTDERVNIFKPMHEGMVTQIDFTKFALYYALTTYGVKAKFKIYNGEGTTGDVLWELTSADDKNIGPGRTVRSTAADGALTVVFSPNDSQGYNNSTGFEATVSEYMSKPMSVSSVATTQTSTDIIVNGAANQQLLTMNVVADGDLTPLTLSGFTLNMKGTQDNISKVRIYSVGNKDTEPAADALPVAETAVTGEAVTVSLAEPMTLQEGNNWFRLNIDLSDNARGDAAVDAAVTGINVGGDDVAVEGGDPEGQRVIKNICLMQAGDNGEVVISQEQPMMFYDDGGADGNVSKGFDGHVTFVPKEEGNVIKFDFEQLSISYTDTLFVYEGAVMDNEHLVNKYYGSTAKETYLVSNAADGKFTVRFFSKGSYSQPKGFAISVKSYRKKAMEITGITTRSIARGAAMPGEGDVKMICAEISTEGDYDNVDIKALRFNVTGAGAIEKIRVFTTDTISAFSTATLYGEAAGNATEVTGTYPIQRNGTYKFWVACDIKADAPAGQEVSLQIASLVNNSTEVPVDASAQVSATLQEGRHGVITVGAGADYGTIQAAVDYISAGVDGPVTINIKKGIYNELVTVPHIPGASANNTITIQSETGNYNDVRVYYNKYTEPQYSDDKMAAEYGVFTINGADWLTLRGIDLTTTDLSFPGVVHIKNMSRHVTIDSCYVHTVMSTEYSSDVNLIYTYSKNEAYCNNDYLTVKNCLLSGGYIGVRMGGTGFVALPKEIGGAIIGNTIVNQGSKALYVMDEQGVVIKGNTIINSETTKSGFNAIDMQTRDACEQPTVIEGNTFSLTAPADVTALAIRQIQGMAEAPALIANNEINILTGSSSSVGVKVSSPSSYMNIVHNTVLLNGEGNTSALWLNDAMKEGVTVQNNVLQNLTGGYVYRFYKAGNELTATFNNNVLYTTGSVFAYNKTDIATFSDWTALTGERQSYNDSVPFLASDMLEPLEAGNLITAVPLGYVTTDICGTPRAQQPTTGAYEYDAATTAPAFAKGYPYVTNVTDTTACVAVKADISAKAYVLVREAGEVAPSSEEFAALDLDSATVRRGNECLIKVDTLTTDAEYIAYVQMVSLRGLAGAITATDRFKASGDVIIEMPAPQVVAEGDTVAAGSQATLTAYVMDGTAPFTVTWQDGRHQEIGSVAMAGPDMATLQYAPQECDDYTVTVTDANGKTASDTCRVVVTGDAVAATMENLWLADEGYWSGPDTNGSLAMGEWGDMQQQGSFVSGSYAFSNNYSLDYGSWSGFAYANRTSTSYGQISDQYNSSVGSGFDGSANYAVAYSSGRVDVLNKADGDSISGFYITNNAYALSSILNGDSYARAFQQGDYLKVIVTGNRADGTTASVDCYLADYRSEKEADHYALDTWQWVDLRPLGVVSNITFMLDGTDKSYGYLNTPAYFCLDNFCGERVIEEGTTITDTDAAMSRWFTFGDAEATVTYAIADALPEDVASMVTLSADGNLLVDTGQSVRFPIVISATQRGKQQFKRFTVDITATGVNAVSDNKEGAEQVYDVAGRKGTHLQRGINIVKMKDGSVKKILRQK